MKIDIVSVKPEEFPQPSTRLATPKTVVLTWIIHEESRKDRKESLKRNRINVSNKKSILILT